jgi:hypothetical protein
LLLLAIDRQRERVRRGGDVDLALSGAVLVELALAGRIAIDAKQVALLDGRGTGDAVLDPVLATLAHASAPHSARHWIARIPGRRLQADHLAALTAQGAVRTRRLAVLRVFYVTEVVVLDPLRLADVRQRLDRIADGQAPLQPRDRALAGLAHACGLAGSLYRGGMHQQARKQLKHLADNHPPHSEIDAAIDTAVAAVRRAVAARHSS